MKIKVSEASGNMLDWLVAKCEGMKPYWDENREDFAFDSNVYLCWLSEFKPSTDWAQGGSIIEREKISLICAEGDYVPGAGDGTPGRYTQYWVADVGMQSPSDVYGPQDDNYGSHFQIEESSMSGPTPLIAAMRCYVASKLGDTVEVPNEII